jgi:hypothetical protein
VPLIQYVFILIALAAAFGSGCMTIVMVYAYRNRHPQLFSQMFAKRWETELSIAGTKTTWSQHLQAIDSHDWPNEGCLLIAIRNCYQQAHTLGIYDRFDFKEPLRLDVVKPIMRSASVHLLAEARQRKDQR